jgi:hypothetical protein
MQKLLVLIAGVWVLSCSSGVAPPVSKQTSTTATLTVDAHNTINITAEQVKGSLSIGSSILKTLDPPPGDDVATPIEFKLNKSLGHFSYGNGNVNGYAELQQLFRMGGDAHIVNTLAYCNGTKGGVLGCTRPNGPMVIFADQKNDWPAEAKGVLWAHEYGHKQLLEHRNSGTAVMAETIDQGHTNVTPCERDHYLGDTSTRCPGTKNDDRRRKPSIEIFIAGIFPEGVPYELGSSYTVANIPALSHILRDCDQQLYWVNAVSVLGMIGDISAFQVLKNFLEDNPVSRCPHVSGPAYLAKEIVPLTMGYILAAHDDAKASKDPRCDATVSNYLKCGLTPSKWNQIPWKNPNNGNIGYRNARLTTMSVLGLGLSGQKDAAESLQSLLLHFNAMNFKIENYEPDVIQVLNEALQTNQHVRNVGLAQYYRDSAAADHK